MNNLIDQKHKQADSSLSQNHIEQFDLMDDDTYLNARRTINISNSRKKFKEVVPQNPVEENKNEKNSDSLSAQIYDDSLANSCFQPQTSSVGLEVHSIVISKVQWQADNQQVKMQYLKDSFDRQIPIGHRDYQLISVLSGCIEQTSSTPFPDDDISNCKNKSISKRGDNQQAERTFEVTRRFKDFKSLHSQMRIKYLECIIPPLPNKSMRDKIAEDDSNFVEKRRYELLQFMKRVVDHPFLSQTEEFYEFLTASKFYHTQSDSKIAQVQEKIGGLWTRLPTLSLSSLWGAKPQVQVVRNNLQHKNTQVLDLKLQQDYDLLVVNASQLIKKSLDQIMHSLKAHIATLEKESQSLNKLISLSTKVRIELDQNSQAQMLDEDKASVKNNYFYDDNDAILEDIKLYQKQQQISHSIFKHDFLIDTISFYFRYLQSLDRSVLLRQDMLDSYHQILKNAPSPAAISNDWIDSQQNRIREVTRGQMHEYAILSQEIQYQVLEGIQKIAKNFAMDI
eukprot:403367380